MISKLIVLMDFAFPSFSIIFTFFLFLFTVLKLGKRANDSASTKKLPPGPRKLPIIGNLHNLASSLPHHALRDLALKYGPLMHLQLGEVSAIVVSSPEFAKEFMKNHDITFASRPEVLASKVIGYDSTSVSFARYGDYWRQIKKICTLELLSAKRVQSFRPVREEEVKILVNRISSKAGSPINLSETVFSSLYSLASKAAFGSRYNDQNRFETAIDEVIKFAAGLNLSDLYPSIKLFYVIDSMKARKARKDVDSVLSDILNEHRKSQATADGVEKEYEDVVDVLLKYEGQNSDGFRLTADNIKAVMLDLYAAGGETTGTTVTWAMAEMMKNPRVMEKAQAEVRQVFDRKGCIDETDFPQLDYIKLVIKEAFRLHPPVPLLLPRECRENCVINGYHIPVKSKVLINVWAIGRDAKYWSDAETFYPERFLESSRDFKGTDFEFLPFGAGRRMCPGISSGLINVELLLAVLLYHFDWKLPDGVKRQDLDMTDSFGVTARRKKDIIAIPIPYQPSPAE